MCKNTQFRNICVRRFNRRKKNMTHQIGGNKLFSDKIQCDVLQCKKTVDTMEKKPNATLKLKCSYSLSLSVSHVTRVHFFPFVSMTQSMANNSYYRLYFGSHAVIVCECVREHISSIFPVNYCYSQEILFIFACISSYISVAYHIDILRERERAKREKK